MFGKPATDHWKSDPLYPDVAELSIQQQLEADQVKQACHNGNSRHVAYVIKLASSKAYCLYMQKAVDCHTYLKKCKHIEIVVIVCIYITVGTAAE